MTFPTTSAASAYSAPPLPSSLSSVTQASGETWTCETFILRCLPRSSLCLELPQMPYGSLFSISVQMSNFRVVFLNYSSWNTNSPAIVECAMAYSILHNLHVIFIVSSTLSQNVSSVRDFVCFCSAIFLNLVMTARHIVRWPNI